MYADETTLYFNEDSGSVVFSCIETVIFNIDHNTINLDNNFDEDDPDTIIIHIRLLAWHIKFEKRKALKDLPIAWYPKRWWNICMSEDEKKDIEPIFTE